MSIMLIYTTDHERIKEVMLAGMKDSYTDMDPITKILLDELLHACFAFPLLVLRFNYYYSRIISEKRL